jgi:hypothetical protein
MISASTLRAFANREVMLDVAGGVVTGTLQSVSCGERPTVWVVIAGNGIEGTDVFVPVPAIDGITAAN